MKMKRGCRETQDKYRKINQHDSKVELRRSRSRLRSNSSSVSDGTQDTEKMNVCKRSRTRSRINRRARRRKRLLEESSRSTSIQNYSNDVDPKNVSVQKQDSSNSAKKSSKSVSGTTRKSVQKSSEPDKPSNKSTMIRNRLEKIEFLQSRYKLRENLKKYIAAVIQDIKDNTGGYKDRDPNRIEKVKVQRQRLQRLKEQLHKVTGMILERDCSENTDKNATIPRAVKSNTVKSAGSNSLKTDDKSKDPVLKGLEKKKSPVDKSAVLIKDPHKNNMIASSSKKVPVEEETSSKNSKKGRPTVVFQTSTNSETQKKESQIETGLKVSQKVAVTEKSKSPENKDSAAADIYSVLVESSDEENTKVNCPKTGPEENSSSSKNSREEEMIVDVVQTATNSESGKEVSQITESIVTEKVIEAEKFEGSENSSANVAVTEKSKSPENKDSAAADIHTVVVESSDEENTKVNCPKMGPDENSSSSKSSTEDEMIVDVVQTATNSESGKEVSQITESIVTEKLFEAEKFEGSENSSATAEKYTILVQCTAEENSKTTSTEIDEGCPTNTNSAVSENRISESERIQVCSATNSKVNENIVECSQESSKKKLQENLNRKRKLIIRLTNLPCQNAELAKTSGRGKELNMENLRLQQIEKMEQGAPLTEGRKRKLNSDKSLIVRLQRFFIKEGVADGDTSYVENIVPKKRSVRLAKQSKKVLRVKQKPILLVSETPAVIAEPKAEDASEMGKSEDTEIKKSLSDETSNKSVQIKETIIVEGSSDEETTDSTLDKTTDTARSLNTTSTEKEENTKENDKHLDEKVKSDSAKVSDERINSPVEKVSSKISDEEVHSNIINTTSTDRISSNLKESGVCPEKKIVLEENQSVENVSKEHQAKKVLHVKLKPIPRVSETPAVIAEPKVDNASQMGESEDTDIEKSLSDESVQYEETIIVEGSSDEETTVGTLDKTTDTADVLNTSSTEKEENTKEKDENSDEKVKSGSAKVLDEQINSAIEKNSNQISDEEVHSNIDNTTSTGRISSNLKESDVCPEKNIVLEENQSVENVSIEHQVKRKILGQNEDERNSKSKTEELEESNSSNTKPEAHQGFIILDESSDEETSTVTQIAKEDLAAHQDSTDIIILDDSSEEETKKNSAKIRIEVSTIDGEVDKDGQADAEGNTAPSDKITDEKNLTQRNVEKSVTCEKQNTPSEKSDISEEVLVSESNRDETVLEKKKSEGVEIGEKTPFETSALETNRDHSSSQTSISQVETKELTSKTKEMPAPIKEISITGSSITEVSISETEKGEEICQNIKDAASSIQKSSVEKVQLNIINVESSEVNEVSSFGNETEKSSVGTNISVLESTKSQKDTKQKTSRTLSENQEAAENSCSVEETENITSQVDSTGAVETTQDSIIHTKTQMKSDKNIGEPKNVDVELPVAAEEKNPNLPESSTKSDKKSELEEEINSSIAGVQCEESTAVIESIDTTKFDNLMVPAENISVTSRLNENISGASTKIGVNTKFDDNNEISTEIKISDNTNKSECTIEKEGLEITSNDEFVSADLTSGTTKFNENSEEPNKDTKQKTSRTLSENQEAAENSCSIEETENITSQVDSTGAVETTQDSIIHTKTQMKSDKNIGEPKNVDVELPVAAEEKNPNLPESSTKSDEKSELEEEINSSIAGVQCKESTVVIESIDTTKFDNLMVPAENISVTSRLNENISGGSTKIGVNTKFDDNNEISTEIKISDNTNKSECTIEKEGLEITSNDEFVSADLTSGTTKFNEKSEEPNKSAANEAIPREIRAAEKNNDAKMKPPGNSETLTVDEQSILRVDIPEDSTKPFGKSSMGIISENSSEMFSQSIANEESYKSPDVTIKSVEKSDESNVLNISISKEKITTVTEMNSPEITKEDDVLLNEIVPEDSPNTVENPDVETKSSDSEETTTETVTKDKDSDDKFKPNQPGKRTSAMKSDEKTVDKPVVSAESTSEMKTKVGENDELNKLNLNTFICKEKITGTDKMREDPEVKTSSSSETIDKTEVIERPAVINKTGSEAPTQVESVIDIDVSIATTGTEKTSEKFKLY